MRLLAIGDIHGYGIALKSLLEAVSPTPSDQLIFLGDYVDKGPDVAGTLDYLCKLSDNNDWVFLRGNHDQLFINAHRDPSTIDLWEDLSGGSPLESYGFGTTVELLQVVPQHHIFFLEDRCRDFHQTDSFLFVHGGIRPHVAPEDEEIERLQWSVLASAEPHESSKTVICGHSSQDSGSIADYGHTICIDTGITKGNSLTCLDLGDFSFIQSSASGKIQKGRLENRNSSGTGCSE